jgi:hypothetical protein
LARPPKIKFKPFKTNGDGEDYGYISVNQHPKLINTRKKILEHSIDEDSTVKNQANALDKKKILTGLRYMSYWDFEVAHLCQLVEALGFVNTQFHARASNKKIVLGNRRLEGYEGGIFVSYKWWKYSVPVCEIKRMHKFSDTGNTIIIITRKQFTKKAKEYVSRLPNRDQFILVDGVMIAEMFFEKGIEIKKTVLPKLSILPRSIKYAEVVTIPEILNNKGLWV